MKLNIDIPNLNMNASIENNIEFVFVYDSNCLICSRFIQLIIQLDREERIYFTSLNSKYAKYLVQKHTILVDKDINYSSALFIENNTVYYYSSSIIRLFYYFKYPWKFIYLFNFIPHTFRDYLYKIFSNNRYKFKIRKSHGEICIGWKKKS